MRSNISLLTFVAGLSLGLIGGSLWTSEATRGVPLLPALPTLITDSSRTGSTTSAGPASDSSGAVAVEPQAPGMSVLVDSVTVPPPGVWVAVRETVGNGLGNVLGAARAPGPRSNFSIPLLRATDPGTRYAVELYRDDGDGTFEQSTDSVYVDYDTGLPVVAYFTTTP